MKKQLLIGISLLICGFAQAQEKEQYFYLLGGGGAHNLNTGFVNSQNTTKGGMGYQLGAGYTYFFNSKWGIQTGIGIQKFNSTSTLNFNDSILNQVDIDGDNYKFHAQYNKWVEKHQALLFEIPLSAIYRYKLSEKSSLLFGLGGKISFPIKTSYKTTGGNISTSGYYDTYNVTLSDIPQNGFPKIVGESDTYYSLKKSSGFSLKPAYLLSFDLGLTRKLNEKADFYIGGYFNYGINNMQMSENKNILSPDKYDAVSQKFIFNYNGVESTAQVKKINPISLGIKLGVYFNFGKNNASRNISSEIAKNDTVFIVREVPKDVIVEKIIYKENGETGKLQQYKDFISVQRMCSLTIIQFKLATETITKYNANNILEISKILKANPALTLHLTGYTDNLSSREFNLLLGMRRAEVVKLKFLDLGVSSSQLVADSKGLDNPIAPNEKERDRQKNRRVELSIESSNK